MAHTRGIENFRSALNRARKDTLHEIGPKRPDRCVAGFAGRHNDRDADAPDRMAGIVGATVGRRLRRHDLIAANGLYSGAQG